MPCGIGNSSNMCIGVSYISMKQASRSTVNGMFSFRLGVFVTDVG
jgi:hypothetical protein